ncbi:MAG: sigma-70 family RNA polymerase sigma factor [Caulobacterales bacterium]
MTAPSPIPTPFAAANPNRERFADLMEAIALRQDREAFAEIFSYYGPRVKGYVLRLGAGEATAEEVAQDVMITVWRKAALFDRRQASVSTWIFRIARNRRIDVARRTNRPDLDATDPSLMPEPPPPPDDAMSALEREERVRVVLGQLPADQLSLLQQAFYEGLSHREIADRTGLPLGTVKSRIRLAFVKMRARLGEGDH